MPRLEFTAGEVLQAATMNDLSDQTVMVFAGTAARGSAIPSPSEGMVTYRSDDDVVEVFDGSVFAPVGSSPAILQVVSAIKTDTFTTSSQSFTDITGVSATITPTSTSSKVLILCSLAVGLTNNTHFGAFRLSGGNAGTFVGDTASDRVRSVYGGNTGANMTGTLLALPMTFLDSPATTSATTYIAQARTRTTFGAATVFVNRSSGDTNDDNNVRGASSITLLEVAG